MKAVFRHLSGPSRGETQAVEKDRIVLGSSPDADVRVGGDGAVDVAERQAEITLSNCNYYLRDLGSGRRTFVNDREVDEIILSDGDQLELGEDGPKLRFFVQFEHGEVCRPVRQVFSDSMKRSRRFGEGPLESLPAFARALGTGLVRESPAATRWVLLGGAALAAGLAVVLILLGFQGATSKKRLEREIFQLKTQLARDRQSTTELRREIADERKKASALLERHDAETRKKLASLEEEERGLGRQLEAAQESSSSRSKEIAELKARLAATAKSIAALDADRERAGRIIAGAQNAVALIEVAFRYADASGMPLRFAGLTSAGRPEKDAEGQTLYATTGTGPIVEVSATGTGFLVEERGTLLTNRHVAEPWWGDEGTRRLAELGFRPKLQHLRAYFPSIAEAVPLSVVAISRVQDVAVVRADLRGRRLPALALEREGAAQPGQSILLLGYPTGLDAILARLDETTESSVVESAGTDTELLARELGSRGLIRPLPTQGHLSDVLANKLVYDAATTFGGSGGPVFSMTGKVIGLNASILDDFGGASFGVPISFALELLDESSRATQ